MSPIKAVNTYPLKWRQLLSATRSKATACGESPPPSFKLFHSRRTCNRPLYHKGPHRLTANKGGGWIWAAGDLDVRRPRGRKPDKETHGCIAQPGAWCKQHRVRHYRPRGLLE